MINVSTLKTKLNIPIIHQSIKKTYFGKNRSLREMQLAIDNSLCFGIYLDEEQIGFARVLTDYVTIANLMDVFIVEEHRKKGYASILLNAVINDAELHEIPVWRLATAKEQFLFEKFGFHKLSSPKMVMEKLSQN